MTNYQTLLDFFVWDIESETCMLNKYLECFVAKALLEGLMNEIDNLPDKISF